MSDKQFGITIGSINSKQTNIGETINATQYNYNTQDGNLSGNEVMNIVGEKDFGVFDQASLRNAGVKTIYVNCYDAPYFDVFLQELKRQREDNKIFKYWHFSGHGDKDKGIQFGNHWVKWDKFNEAITPYDEIEVLFLAACSSINVADVVSGKIKWVLASAVDIPNLDAAKATEIFWKNVSRGKSVEEAFEATKLNIPHFAPNLRLRGV